MNYASIHDPDASGPSHLIMIDRDRLVSHTVHVSPEVRLQALVTRLTAVDVFARVPAAMVLAIAGDRSDAQTADVTANRIAKLARRYQVLVFFTGPEQPGSVPTAPVRPARPESSQAANTGTGTAPKAERLFSVITEYCPGQSIVEHFDSRQSRHDSLVERAGHLAAGELDVCLPELSKDDAMLATFIQLGLNASAVTLTDAAWDQSTRSYHSDLDFLVNAACEEPSARRI